MANFTKHQKEIIGNKIKRLRKKKKKRQLDIAAEAGINDSYYSKIERGEVNPSLEILYKIIKALGVKSSDILPF